MKKIVLPLIIGVSALTFIISCKHEIPADTMGGGSNPPPVVNCSPDTAYFQQQVLPIFISNCSVSGCHDAISHQDGVVLTNNAQIMNTGDIRPGNPNGSEAFEKITDPDKSDRMPPAPRNRLSTSQVDVIGKWIMQGAKNNSCQSSSCDTSQVLYSTTIRNIISNKCQGCHSGNSAGGGYDYSSYSGLKARADDGKLLGTVHQTINYDEKIIDTINPFCLLLINHKLLL